MQQGKDMLHWFDEALASSFLIPRSILEPVHHFHGEINVPTNQD